MANYSQLGKYTIIKKLDSGGMADILLAVNLSPTGFGHFLCIKRALSKFSDNEEFKDMFKNEAKIACNLKHKNVISIYEFGIEKSQFFLVMEYISGKNLRHLVKTLRNKRNSLNIEDAVYILKEVASGLNYVHNAIDLNTGLPLNVIHRDVSPQNIMLSFDGEVKLIDFGIAKIADTNLTKAGHLKGKFSYMSPEQARGEELDERTDIFCLGIILWELLTSKRLFASKNEMVSLRKVRNCEIPDAQSINANIPNKLNDIVMKALTKNRNSRYKTASKFERDLNLYLNKNYPEYSHYNLINMMKTVYMKDILSERESLKYYASDFKKYINALNIEKTLKTTQVNLKIADNQAAGGITTKLSTETFFTEADLTSKTNNGSQINEKLSEMTFKPKTDYTSAEQKKTEDRSTIIQSNSLMVTQTKNTKSSLKTDAPPQAPQHTPTSEVNLKMRQKPINTTQKSLISYSSLSTGVDPQITQERTNNFLKSVKQVFTTVIALAFLVGVFIMGKSVIFPKEEMASVDLGLTQPAQVPPNQNLSFQPDTTTSPKKERNPASSSYIKKVFIKSKPSNAKIYLNGAFTSKYTPSILNLDLNYPAEITIKKVGYEPEVLSINTNSSNHIRVNLSKRQTRRRQIQITQ